jgi:hypothetical protein
MAAMAAPANMESLFARATSLQLRDVVLPSGGSVPLRHLTVRFGTASPDRLKAGALPATYTSKPLVTFGGDAMFGELALLRWLEVDGWEGVWLDTVHGRRAWRDMPTRATPVALPAEARALYDRIVTQNGGRASGTFDVMAWRGSQMIFVEYLGLDERLGKHAPRWVQAALDAGVSANDLLIVASG